MVRVQTGQGNPSAARMGRVQASQVKLTCTIAPGGPRIASRVQLAAVHLPASFIEKASGTELGTTFHGADCEWTDGTVALPACSLPPASSCWPCKSKKREITSSPARELGIIKKVGPWSLLATAKRRLERSLDAGAHGCHELVQAF